MNYMQFAMEKHKLQLRRYTLDPYWLHLAQVAGTVGAYDPSGIALAWLHDTVEDTETTPLELTEQYGTWISMSVMMLSDLEEGNRAHRNKMKQTRLAATPGIVQSVKYADILSNGVSIRQHDPKFWLVYKEETYELMQVMLAGNSELRQHVMKELYGA